MASFSKSIFASKLSSKLTFLEEILIEVSNPSYLSFSVSILKMWAGICVLLMKWEGEWSIREGCWPVYVWAVILSEIFF